MQISVKIGNKKPSLDLKERMSYWTNFQVIDIRPDGYYDKSPSPHRCVIQTNDDFWKIRGTTSSREDWKSTKPSVYALKKYLYVADGNGLYPWEAGYNEKTKPQRVRDWFIDLKDWLDKGWITKSHFDSLFDYKKVSPHIYSDRDFTSYLFHEEDKTRLDHDFSNVKASWTSGDYTIGAVDPSTMDGHATDLADAESNLDAQFTGDVTLHHLDEETAISAAVTFDVDTNAHTLTITAESGAEHNGGAYGNGARINYGTVDSIKFDETTAGHLAKVEVSKLAIDASGSANYGISASDCGDTSLTIYRMLVKCDADSHEGIFVNSDAAFNVLVYDNIVYGSSGATEYGISLVRSIAGGTCQVYNNTCIGNDINIYISWPGSGSHTIKNNLCQDAVTSDYSLTNVDSSSKNISEDATSPDAAYQSKDLHTNSVFEDYASDDYRLDADGDSTNLAIVDDGDDLSGTFEDDIEGQTRDTWYIGASEIVAAGGWSGTKDGIDGPSSIDGISTDDILSVDGIE